MRTDQTDICARSQSAPPRFEDAAEREWARLHGLLSSDSASAGQARCFARPPKRRIATFGVLGSLGAVSVFAFTFAVPSLGVATQDNDAILPMSPVVAARPLPVAANPLPEVQSGRSTAIAEPPPAPGPIAAPRLESKPLPPMKDRPAVTATTTRHKGQTHSAVPTSRPREAAVRPMGRTKDRWYRVPAWRYDTSRYQTYRYQTYRYY